jgi:hypothetical protein
MEVVGCDVLRERARLLLVLCVKERRRGAAVVGLRERARLMLVLCVKERRRGAAVVGGQGCGGGGE